MRSRFSTELGIASISASCFYESTISSTQIISTAIISEEN